jgi:hypothetical protein
MNGSESSSQQTAKTASAVENPTVLGASVITRIARVLDRHKKMNMTTKSKLMEPFMPEDDYINNPDHYTWHPAEVECHIIAQEFDYNVGTAIAYLWRAGIKTDEPLVDIRKAIKHLEFECARLDGSAQPSVAAPDPSREQVDKYGNELDKNTFFKRP